MRSCLIVRLGSLGDIVHAIPTATALRGAFPDARIDWVTDPKYVALLDLVPVLDRRIGIDTRALVSGSASLFTVCAGLRRARYDVAIDLQGLLKSAILARIVGARRTVGFPRQHLREPLAGLFYSEAPDPGPAGHIVHKNLGLVTSLGVSDSRPRFAVTVPRSPRVDAVIERVGAEGFVLINPGAAWPNKRWPPARFGAVAEAARKRYGSRSIVLWGPGEEPLAAEVVAASAGAAEMSPPTTIPEIFALSKAARLMISGDTGPLHIAGAVGTPLVALFGPTRSERNGPWAASDLVISRTNRCACLYERQCRLAQPCINDIQVDEVIAAVGRRLAAHG